MPALIAIATMLAAGASAAAAQQPVRESDKAAGFSAVLAEVNGEPITDGDVELLMVVRQVHPRLRERFRRDFLEELVERRLLAEFVEKRGAEPPAAIVEQRTNRILANIRENGSDPQKLLAKLGHTEKSLRGLVAGDLAWRQYVRRVITDAQLRGHFEKHRHEYDGTEIRASQILMKRPEGADEKQIQALREKLDRIREEVVGGKTSFAEAARKHSEAPSKSEGGDVGWFPYRGKMPTVFTREVFPLKKGEVSRPFATPFGVHLAVVTDVKPGRLSLEDVRQLVFRDVAERTRRETLEKLKRAARIEWKSPHE